MGKKSKGKANKEVKSLKRLVKEMRMIKKLVIELKVENDCLKSKQKFIDLSMGVEVDGTEIHLGPEDGFSDEVERHFMTVYRSRQQGK